MERRFPAAREVLWRTWTDPQRLDRWWGPRGWPTTTKTFDLRVGGLWHYSMRGPDGTVVWTRVEFFEVQPLERLVSRSWFSTAEAEIVSTLPSMLWEVAFAAQPGGTLLSTQLNFDDLEGLETVLKMGFQQGYSEQLEQLQDLVEVQE